VEEGYNNQGGLFMKKKVKEEAKEIKENVVKKADKMKKKVKEEAKEIKENIKKKADKMKKKVKN
jgi:vacuolar-type H+-ATPase subunit E/Vma4